MSQDQEWWPISSKKSKIQLEWSRTGSPNVRVRRTERDSWLYGSARNCNMAESVGEDLIYEEEVKNKHD